MYTGTLSYFAQLQAQHQLSAIAFKANIFPIFNTDPTNPTQAISTIKALQLANTQGQQIYKIDSTNIDTVLPKLNLSSTIKQDIQSSVNAGKYVITHTDNVSVPGWSGAGYAIIDPLTGSDAYLISGGENGGYIGLTYGYSFAILLFVGSTYGMPHLLAAALAMLITIIAVYNLYGVIYGEEMQKCFVTGVAFGILAGGVSIAMFRRLPFSVAQQGSTFATTLILTMSELDTMFYDSDPLQECLQ